MGTAIAAGDILLCRSWCTQDAQAAVNTLAYECISVTGGGVTDQDFADVQEPGLATFYKALMSPGGTFRGIQVYYAKRAGGFLPNPVKATAHAGDGTTGTNSLPKNTCPILKFNTTIRGPGGRGRNFLPFASADYVTPNGIPDAALLILINSLASALLPPIVVTVGANTATLVWSVMHRNPPAGPVTSNQIVSAEAVDRFGQMHKRGDYGRANSSPI